MGKTKNAGASGKVGNIIYYEYRGKPCCRSVPDEVEQTEATKASATQFGLAARLGKLFRMNLRSILPDEKDKHMLYSLNKAIQQWLRHVKPDENTFSPSNFFIDQFQFNESALLPVMVKRPIVARFVKHDTISVEIPELMPGKDIMAPPGTKKIHWHIKVIKCALDFNKTYCSPIRPILKHQIEMQYDQDLLPAQVITLSYELTSGALTLVCIRLKYEIDNNGELEMVTDKRWMPAGIIGSCFGRETSKG